MTLIVADRVQETSTTTGTGAYTLLGATTGYRAASTVCANGDTFTYFAEDIDVSGRPIGGWETGLGTWGTGNVLTRTTIYASSNAGSAVSWAAGTRKIGLGLVATAAIANLRIAGLAGTGYLTMPGQSVNPTSPAAGTLLIHAKTVNGFTRMEQDNEAATNVIYGRDSVFVAQNPTGVTIPKGSCVWVSGTINGAPQVQPARANSAGTMPCVGITLDAIAATSYGQVLVSGLITFDTSAFSAGDQVWVSSTVAGGLTAARPSGTNFVQRMGTVIVSGNATTGLMFVQTAPAILNQETGTNAAAWVAQGTIAASNFSGTSSGTNTGDQTLPTALPTPNAVTFNSSGTGAASGTTFNGSTTQTISYNTLGAIPSTSIDTSSGVPGLTLYKLNLKNAANTFTNYFTNTTTASRTWTLPDKDGTVAMTVDLPTVPVGATPGLTLGTSNIAGSATTFVKTDATILAFDATTPVAVDSSAAGAGSATVAARRDHKHIIATLTGTVSGIVTAQGSSNTSYYLNGNGAWSIPPDTNTWTALTSTVSGYVTANGSADTTKFLNANGAWAVPPDTNTWTALTGTVSGYVTTQGSSATNVWLNGNGAWSAPTAAQVGAVAPTDVTYIGTTSIAHNRTSAAQALTGITSIDGYAATLNTASNYQVSKLGVGVAPTTGWSFTGSIDVGTSAAFTGNSSVLSAMMAANTYYNGTNWIYKNTGYTGRVIANSGGAGDIDFYIGPSGTAAGTVSEVNVLKVTSAGNLTVSGTAQTTSFGVGTTPSGTTGEIRATNNITAYYSDDRLKTRTGNIENALDKVSTLDTFYYHANETAQALGYEPIDEVGISAQQVQEIMPQVVAPAPIDDQYLTVRYERLVPLLIASIKELKSELAETNRKLNELIGK